MRKMTPYESFIHTSRYARWRDEDNRRATWTETVDRYIEFFREHLSENYGVDPKDDSFKEVRKAILNRDVMPSMRALMSAGPALKKSHMAGYNCSFIAVDDTRVFSEIAYILMNGTGVGFSVERKSVEMLPSIPEIIVDSEEKFIIGDSREGWSSGINFLIENLYQGRSPVFDFSEVRPAGARLKTFGGRASGPEPLEQLFAFTLNIFKGAAGRRLNPLEVHDIVCEIGSVVVSGGVRRSALISLSDLTNPEMANAKSGAWWENNGQRALANNSAVYTQHPSAELFLKEWLSLIESRSGERGIFNLEGVRKFAPERRDSSQLAGTNPCGEITLRSAGLCNLSEVVIRAEDSEADVLHKVGIAAIVGTWQSTLTDFKFVRAVWRENAEEERLLGVSLTGIYTNPMYSLWSDAKLPRRLESLKKRVRVVNEEWAERLGVNASVATTTVKPSGTVSQLTGVSSGIHPWFSELYERTVRANNSDPLTKLMIDAGVPNAPDVSNPDRTTVFSFPIKAPVGAVVGADIGALAHLELYKVYRMNYVEHSVSVTVTVKPDEWIAVANWVFKNWDYIAGLSFLPSAEGHTYAQAPYQALDAEQFAVLVDKSPAEVRWEDLVFYELEDGTIGSRELACSADTGCEVVDI